MDEIGRGLASDEMKLDWQSVSWLTFSCANFLQMCWDQQVNWFTWNSNSFNILSSTVSWTSAESSHASTARWFPSDISYTDTNQDDGTNCGPWLLISCLSYPPPSLTFLDQFAFRPTGSTSAAIISLLSKITELLQSNPYVIVMQLDFSKAFDTVRHSTLLAKMAELEIPVPVYNWIVDFFGGHSHRTMFNWEESSTTPITASIITRLWHTTSSLRCHIRRPEANALREFDGEVCRRYVYSHPIIQCWHMYTGDWQCHTLGSGKQLEVKRLKNERDSVSRLQAEISCNAAVTTARHLPRTHT